MKKTEDKVICFHFHAAGMAELGKIKAEGNRLELRRLNTAGGGKNLWLNMAKPGMR